jgi:hypothetical protein
VDDSAGRRALDFQGVLNRALALAAAGRDTGGTGVAAGPLPRAVHVVRELERPSGKFIDGSDGLHWVFEKGFVERLLTGHAAGTFGDGVPAVLACRFLRDASFPDEKLPVERQHAAAVKGTIEAYRFYQSLPQDTRADIAAFYASHPPADPLIRLFLRLETEGNPARAGHMIRDTTAGPSCGVSTRTHPSPGRSW